MPIGVCNSIDDACPIHGFRPPGPIPSPPPGPPAPPARGGFRLQNGTGTGSACLSVDMTTYVATLAACDAGSQTLWNATYDGELYSTLPTCGTGDKFLRYADSALPELDGPTPPHRTPAPRRGPHQR